MATRSGFFNSKNGDRKYNAQVFTDIFAKLMTNGVYANPATSLQVQANDTEDMGVKIAEGFGMINGFYFFNDGEYSLDIDDTLGTYMRIDRVVLRHNKTDRTILPVVIKGLPATSPVAPDLVRDGTFYDIGLATVSVSPTATSISQEDISDTRNDGSVCGTITGAVQSVDTTNLFAQYEAEWELLKAFCQQDADAILEKFNQFSSVKSVNGVEADDNKNITLTLDNIEDGLNRNISGVKNKTIKFGTATTISGSVTTTITFDTPFSSVPTVVANGAYDNSSYSVGVQIVSATTNGFTMKMKSGTGTEYGKPFNWIAIGEIPVTE